MLLYFHCILQDNDRAVVLKMESDEKLLPCHWIPPCFKELYLLTFIDRGRKERVDVILTVWVKPRLAELSTQKIKSALNRSSACIDKRLTWQKIYSWQRYHHRYSEKERCLDCYTILWAQLFSFAGKNLLPHLVSM